jgi:hypothetical protein
MSDPKLFMSAGPADLDVPTLIAFALAELGRAPTSIGGTMRPAVWEPWQLYRKPEECGFPVPGGPFGGRMNPGQDFIAQAVYDAASATEQGVVWLHYTALRDNLEGEYAIRLWFEASRPVWDYVSEAVVLTTVKHLSPALWNRLNLLHPEPIIMMIDGTWTSPEMQGLSNMF